MGGCRDLHSCTGRGSWRLLYPAARPSDSDVARFLFILLLLIYAENASLALPSPDSLIASSIVPIAIFLDSYRCPWRQTSMATPSPVSYYVAEARPFTPPFCEISPLRDPSRYFFRLKGPSSRTVLGLPFFCPLPRPRPRCRKLSSVTPSSHHRSPLFF